jgi:SAM-dependent methyltransferase
MNPGDQPQDPIAEFKAKQRETWALGDFGQIAVFTTEPAARLVRFAGVKSGQGVLDVGTGTGVVALTAARVGAKATGIDLTPRLLEEARLNGEALGFDDVVWRVGDVEDLSFPDSSFDVVLSQFGHIHAPRPEIATKEMLRVLKSGGTVAFATWAPDQLMGRAAALGAKYVPPPPGVPLPTLWGDPNVVGERLGAAVRDLVFQRETMKWNALSPRHYRLFHETYTGGAIRLVQSLSNTPGKLGAWRREYDAIVSEYFEDNVVRLEYLLSRATKV